MGDNRCGGGLWNSVNWWWTMESCGGGVDRWILLHGGCSNLWNGTHGRLVHRSLGNYKAYRNLTLHGPWLRLTWSDMGFPISFAFKCLFQQFNCWGYHLHRYLFHVVQTLQSSKLINSNFCFGFHRRRRFGWFLSLSTTYHWVTPFIFFIMYIVHVSSTFFKISNCNWCVAMQLRSNACYF